MSPHTGPARQLCIEYPRLIPTTRSRIQALTPCLFPYNDYSFKLYSIFPRPKRSMADSSIRTDKLSNPAQPKLRKEDSGVGLKRDSKSPQPDSEQDANLYFQSLREETLHLYRTPIAHPWIAPPTPLPGPYHAPYYPLPLPTIQRCSQDAAIQDCQEISLEHYTRRLSGNSELSSKTTLQGSTTTSAQGWRRTQWSVAAG